MNVPKSHRQPQWTHCVKIACCSSQLICTFPYVGSSSSIHNASEQFACCIHLPSVNFALHSTLQKKPNGVRSGDSNKQLYLGNQLEIDTSLYELSFSQWQILSLKYWPFRMDHPVYRIEWLDDNAEWTVKDVSGTAMLFITVFAWTVWGISQTPEPG